MEVLGVYGVDRGQTVRAEGYVKEFTRHSNDVLLNLNELRHRGILTDTTLVVGSVQLQAHCAVLVACSGFFYSLYSHRVMLQGRGGGSREPLRTVSLPSSLDPSCVSLLLDFMYTSRLPLTPSIVSGVLAAAAYLQMDHVADTCRGFMQLHCLSCVFEKLFNLPRQPFRGGMLRLPQDGVSEKAGVVKKSEAQFQGAKSRTKSYLIYLAYITAIKWCYVLENTENVSARHPRMELDSSVSVTSASPKGGELPGPGPQQSLPAAADRRKWRKLLFLFHLHIARSTAAAAACVPLSVGRFPVVAEGFLKPGAFPPCQPGSDEVKEHPDSPVLNARTLSPNSPDCSSCHPNSPAESSTCSKNPEIETKATPDPKACNWKKYKYIVLNPLCTAAAAVKVEESEEVQCQDLALKAPTEAWSGEVPGQIDRQRKKKISGYGKYIEFPHQTGAGLLLRGFWPSPSPRAASLSGSPKRLCLPQEGASLFAFPVSPGTIIPKLLPSDPEAAQLGEPPIKCENRYLPFAYSGSLQGTKSGCSGETFNIYFCFFLKKHKKCLTGANFVLAGDKPYRCNVCGAQFNRPANLKTHTRIHSGEKPYRCDTCGARFVQVAHLRAHVLIHTGEKPYPCHTCGTRFRHLQTLKSHLRIHTGEKPYSCEKCDLYFRHKSQLRLHLRQKHGAITNTKIRYKVLTEPFQPLLQAC
uniref:BCL6B transcription repressor n=1 Tax=Poecilia formosa TaxID=48698 RepID=A0A087XUP3_POEFO